MSGILISAAIMIFILTFVAKLKYSNPENMWRKRLRWYRLDLVIGFFSVVLLAIVTPFIFRGILSTSETFSQDAVGIFWITMTWGVCVAALFAIIKERNLFKNQMLAKGQSLDDIEIVEDAKWAEDLQAEEG